MLKIAIQKSGRLSEQSLRLIEECGIRLATTDRKLKADAANFPIQVLFLRDDDIPQYVEDGVADIGIVGENEVWEKGKDVRVIRQLGFARCRLSLAIAKDESYEGLSYFNGKKIATSYPRILRKQLAQLNIEARIEEVGGSVEIAPGVGLAQGIFDIVGTGSTLLMNGLKEVCTLVHSEAVLIANNDLSAEAQSVLSQLLFRISAVRNAGCNKYILLNAPNERLEEIVALLPGMKSPTVLPLALSGWSSVHTVIREQAFWEVISQLRSLGAEGILVVDIEKMIL
ncbi:ATP phosphoribosyltransferase [Rurimicrobium arvi]|uniref:ATP phosphoribosyltransferase n=1 Tax=Rurimicrobium arvi TaxID=2049916 RepID=A0ABP8N2C6_9BACT